MFVLLHLFCHYYMDFLNKLMYSMVSVWHARLLCMFIDCYHAVAMNYVLNVILEILTLFVTSKFPGKVAEIVTRFNTVTHA